MLLELIAIGEVVEAAALEDAAYKLTSVLEPKTFEVPVAARLMVAVDVHNIAYSPKALASVEDWAQ